MELGQSSYPRRKTRQIMVGDVPVGGDVSITVQSMTITKTADVEGTLQQIYDLAMAGCDIVRCTCNEIEAAEGLARIVPRSPVPIVADIHHNHRMAPRSPRGRGPLPPPQPGQHPQARAHQAGGAGGQGPRCPHPHRRQRRLAPPRPVQAARRQGHAGGHGRVRADGAGYFDEVGFEDVKISVKASSVPLMIEAYRQLSDAVDHPLHLGVTEVGPMPGGLIKATAGIATLLAEGIGDTIRYSLTADPVEEAQAGRAPGVHGAPRARTSTSSPARRAAGPRST